MQPRRQQTCTQDHSLRLAPVRNHGNMPRRSYLSPRARSAPGGMWRIAIRPWPHIVPILILTMLFFVSAPQSAPLAFMSTDSAALCAFEANSPDNTPFTADAFSGQECPAYPQATFCTGPSCDADAGICLGADQYSNQSACQGAACCLKGSLLDGGTISVVPYLGRTVMSSPTQAEQIIDDSPGLANAIKCASSLPTTRKTVYFPPGRYILRTPLRPHFDHLTLTGPAIQPGTPFDASTSAILIARPCNPEQFPGAVQISDAPAQGVWIQNFQVDLTDGPHLPPASPQATSASGIQVNQCTKCRVTNILMRYAPLTPEIPACKPYNLDGITFAVGSGGVISNVLVDGVPKVGLYLASVPAIHGAPPVLITDCEVRNSNGPLGAVGMGISAANATVQRCNVHHNLLHPVDGTPGPEGTGLLIATQPDVLGAPSIPTDIFVTRSHFHHNGGTGITIGSVIPDGRPHDIMLQGVRTSYNGGSGLRVEAATDLDIVDMWSWGNAHFGMAFTSSTNLPPATPRVDTVVVDDALIFENRLSPASLIAGMFIQASDITVNGGKILRCARGNQIVGIWEEPWQMGLGTNQEQTFQPENNIFSGVTMEGITYPYWP